MRLIDADKLKRKCQKVATEAWKMKIKASAETIMNQFIDFIDETDAVDAVPVRHGNWINIRNENVANCDICGARGRTWMRFCHDCGARMDERGDGNG